MFLSPISRFHQSCFHRSCFHRSLLGAIASTLLVTTATVATAGAQAPAARFAAPTPRIVEHVDEDRLSTLSGNTRPEARSQNDRGAVSPDMRMDKMTLVLRRGPEQQAAFDAFVASQYDQKSPNFHKWLTPDEVGTNFGPAQSDIDTVTSWLLNHSFSVDEISKNRLFITFSGTAALVQSAFHTEIHHLDVKGQPHVANMRDPQIPSALTPVVVGVQALHNFFPHPLHKLGGQAQRNSKTGAWERISAPVTPNSAKAELGKSGIKPKFGVDLGGGDFLEDVAPYDFATIYNVLPLWTGSAALDGTGQSIAIVATSNVNTADITNFRKSFGLPAGKSIIVKEANGDPGDCSTGANSCINDLYENSLDVEWSSAMAHNAQIILVVANPGTGTDFNSDPVFIDSKYIVDNNTAPIVNVSYGECELGFGTAANAATNSMWQTAASQGQSVFVASGDEGSASCDAGGDSSGVPYAAEYGLSVSGLASTPYNTAVGGTDFNWEFVSTAPAPYWSTSNSSTTRANALKYIPEVPWNGTCTNPLVLPTVQSYAKDIGVVGVTDAETACSFIYEYNETIIGEGGPDLSFLIDTVGGSGGKSSCTTTDSGDPTQCTGGYAKPSWQAGVAGIPADGKRDIPDLSFFASSGFLNSAYLVCVSAGGSACTYTDGTEPVGQEVGGTSVASPITAGIMALINQAAKSNQGLMNPELYKLAKTQTYSACSSESVTNSSACIFNDIDTGTIAMPCDLVDSSPDCPTQHQSDPVGVLTIPGTLTDGYDAGVGFDLATGLGSANVANLVNAYVTDVTPVPGISFNPNTLTFPSTTVLTAATNQTITVSNTGSASLAFTSVALSGSGASSFSIVSNTCTTTVATSATCKVTVGFTPTSAATFSATLVFTDNVSGSPQSVTLTGSRSLGGHTCRQQYRCRQPRSPSHPLRSVPPQPRRPSPSRTPATPP